MHRNLYQTCIGATPPDVLIRFPAEWPTWLTALVAMTVLAALDLGGLYAAKEAVVRRSPVFAGIGVTAFVVLFWVFASSLQYAELTPVTFGWIVILQVGVVVLDRYRYGVTITQGQWIALAVMIMAQAYLLLGLPGAPRWSDLGAPSATGQQQSDVVGEPSDVGAERLGQARQIPGGLTDALDLRVDVPDGGGDRRDGR